MLQIHPLCEIGAANLQAVSNMWHQCQHYNYDINICKFGWNITPSNMDQCWGSSFEASNKDPVGESPRCNSLIPFLRFVAAEDQRLSAFEPWLKPSLWWVVIYILFWIMQLG